jgi:hypothetical protein
MVIDGLRLCFLGKKSVGVRATARAGRGERSFRSRQVIASIIFFTPMMFTTLLML